MSTQMKTEGETQVQIDHVEEVTPNEEDFVWSYTVISNLAALYMTYISCTWGLIAFPINIAFINQAFPTESNYSTWVAAVISLAQCVLSLFIGELSDIYGRRWFIAGGNFLMMIGNLIASRGTSVSMIIGGQVLVGMGVSLGILATPLLAEAVPKRNRGLVIAIAIGGVAMIASYGAIGLGAFVKYDVGGIHQGWRVGGYLGAGFGLISLLLTIIFYHPGHRKQIEGFNSSKRLRMLDWFGIFVGTAGLTLVLLALDFGGNPYEWSSAIVLCLLLIGLFLLCVFIIWETKYVSFGLFPKALFKHRNYGMVLATQFCEGMAVNTAAAFLIQIQFIEFTSDPVMAQVRNVPYGTSSMVGAVITATILSLTKETKPVILGSLAFGTLGAGLMSLLKPDSSYALWFFATIFIGISISGMGISVSVVASLCTPNELIATALSLCNSTRGLGGAVGIVIFSQTLATKLKESLPTAIATATVSAGLPITSVPDLLVAYFSEDPSSVSKVSGITPAVLAALEESVKEAYASSFAFMWYAMVAFIGFTFFFTLFLKPTKSMTTGEVASAVLEKHKHGHKNDEKHVEDVRER